MGVELSAAGPARSDFDSLFRDQYARIYHLIRRITGDPGAAEELAADVFVKLLRKPPSPDVPVDRWLSQSAVWSAIDHLRSCVRQSTQKLEESLRNPHGQEQWEVREEQWRVRTVLQRISREQATLLLLREEGYTYAEISAALGRNPASVGVLLVRAEAAFRKEWVKAYGERR